MKQPNSISEQNTPTGKLAPELTKEGIESLLRVATAINDPTMLRYWPEIEGILVQNLDKFTDEQIKALMLIPHWMKVLDIAEPSLSSESRLRLDALRPRNAVSAIFHFVRRKVREWQLPTGVTLADSDYVITEYRERCIKEERSMHPDEKIAIMNAVINARFPDLDAAARLSIRIHFCEEEGLINTRW